MGSQRTSTEQRTQPPSNSLLSPPFEKTDSLRSNLHNHSNLKIPHPKCYPTAHLERRIPLLHKASIGTVSS